MTLGGDFVVGAIAGMPLSLSRAAL